MKRIRALAISISKPVERLTTGVLWIAGAGLTTMAVLTFSSAMARWALDRVLIFANEITEYIFVGVALLSFAFVLRTESHIRIPVVFDRLPGAAKPWLQFISDIIVLVFVVILLIASVRLVVDSYQLHAISITVLGVVQWIPQMVLPIGFSLLLLEALVKVLKKLEHF